MQLIRIGYNHDTGRKFGNLIVVLKKISAQFQLENWSAPAWLGSEFSQLGLARAGKFQLEPISTILIYQNRRYDYNLFHLFSFSLQKGYDLVVQIVHEGTIISRAQNNVGNYATSTGTAIIPMEIGQKVSDSLLFGCMCN